MIQKHLLKNTSKQIWLLPLQMILKSLLDLFQIEFRISFYCFKFLRSRLSLQFSSKTSYSMELL